MERGRRGATVFEHLRDQPEDFLGALERGVATRERTIHLFAWQSHLWNRAAVRLVKEIVAAERPVELEGRGDSQAPVLREDLDAATSPYR